MSRTTFYIDEDIHLTYELINEQLFVHVEFGQFSKTILTRLRQAWIKFLFWAFFEGYEYIFTYTRDPRIVNMIGGSEEIGQDDPKLSEMNMRMYKWELTQ